LWEFSFSEIESKILQITQNDDINPLHKKGFENFCEGLNEFLTENKVKFDEESSYFRFYSSASVESTDIIRTSGSFYGNEWFSDVAISVTETMWYRKVIFLIFIIIKLNPFRKLYNDIYLIFRRSYC